MLLLIGAQLRKRWARWGIVFIFGIMAANALLHALRDLASGSSNNETLMGASIFVPCMFIAVHLALGEPTKRYFQR